MKIDFPVVHKNNNFFSVIQPLYSYYQIWNSQNSFRRKNMLILKILYAFYKMYRKDYLL